MLSTAKTQLALPLDAEMYTKIEKIAFAENRTLTNMIEYLITQEIRRFESDNGEVSLRENEYPVVRE